MAPRQEIDMTSQKPRDKNSKSMTKYLTYKRKHRSITRQKHSSNIPKFKDKSLSLKDRPIS